jgi:hypothetical protein
LYFSTIEKGSRDEWRQWQDVFQPRRNPRLDIYPLFACEEW